MGIYFHYPGNVWRSLLCFVPIVLFYQLRFGLLGVDYHSFLVHNSGVSYEFQNKAGNLLGVKTFQTCLIINGIVGPLLLGGAVATFFTGSNFIVEKANIVNSMQPVISHWANASRGLDVLLTMGGCFWNCRCVSRHACWAFFILIIMCPTMPYVHAFVRNCL